MNGIVVFSATLTQIGTDPRTLRQSSVSVNGLLHILHFQRTNRYGWRWRMHIRRCEARTVIGIGSLIAVGAGLLFRLAILRMVLRSFAVTRLEATVAHQRRWPFERTLGISAQVLDTIVVSVWCDISRIEFRLTMTR